MKFVSGCGKMRQSIFDMEFSKVYPLLVQKAERKGRTQADVDEMIDKLKRSLSENIC